MAQSYEDRIRRVLRYIHDNPTGDLSLDAICDVAAMSRFHWHRVFRAMTGETCAEAVRRIRAYRAAGLLVQNTLSVSEVARQTGFRNRKSFSRVFQDHFGMTPVQFRKSGKVGDFSIKQQKGLWTMFDVEIKQQDALHLAGLGHKGSYLNIGGAFEQVSSLFTARQLWHQARGMAGVYYDDPGSVDEAELRSFAGVMLAPDAPVPDGLEAVQLPAGECAVLQFKGPYAGLKGAYDYLYGEWLPTSGRLPDDSPAYEIYANSPMDTAPEDLLTNICAPLKVSA